MENFTIGFLCGFVLSLFVALMIGASFGLTPQATWQQEAVDRGHAHHDSQTGKWQWNNEGEQ